MGFNEWWEQYLQQGGKSHFNIHADEESARAAWNGSIEAVLMGLRSENDSTQLRAIIASVEYMRVDA